MKIYIASLGCKLNESEIETWARQFGASGHEIVNDAQSADICILNTCTVTSEAARKSRTTARHLAKLNPEAGIVLTGCYATLSPDQAALLPQVIRVIPNHDKDTLVKIAGKLWDDELFRTLEAGCRLPEASSGELTSEFAREHSTYNHRTRAFVKIEDGCNMACSYCIIPLARGRERSRPAEKVIEEIAQLRADGYNEIILTGVQISDYENGGNKKDGLARLVRQILAETNVPRLRLTSIAPWDLSYELLELFADSRICKHLHLSLQSGSDSILRRMRRPYTSAQYARSIDRARHVIPGVGITTDVIVGFPGESEIEFDESLRFVESIGFARVHVFPYSRREGTVAAGLSPHVKDQERDQRVARMQAAADTAAEQFARRFVGSTMAVLWEHRNKSGRGDLVWSGYTDNYIRVYTQSDADLQNVITDTRLTGLAIDGTYGNPLLFPSSLGADERVNSNKLIP